MPAPIVALLVLAVVLGLSLVIGHLDVVRAFRAQKLLARGSPLIDVDPPEVFDEEHHPDGAINVPLDDLAAIASELDPSHTIIVFGHNSLRSAMAAHALRARGFRVLDLGPAQPDNFGGFG